MPDGCILPGALATGQFYIGGFGPCGISSASRRAGHERSAIGMKWD